MFWDSKVSKKTYVKNIIIVLLIGFLGTFFITSAVNARIQEIFVNEAINLSKSYSQMLNLSTTANKNLEDSVNQRLSDVLRLCEKNEKEMLENQETLNNIIEYTELSVINFFDADGVVIASSMPEYVGEALPDTHPIRTFMDEDKTLKHDSIRESIHSNNKLKHSYIKTENGNIIQVSIGYKHIAELSQEFHPQYLLNSLKADIDVIDVEMIFDDSFDSFVIDKKDIVSMTAFKAEAMKSKEIIHQVRNENMRSILEVGVPIYHEDSRIGTLIVFRNLKMMDTLKNKTMNLLISLSALIILLYILDILNTYRKELMNKEKSYLSNHEGIFNKKYLIDYIDSHADRITNNQMVFFIINLNSYERFKLILNEEEFKTAIHTLKDIILEHTGTKKEVFQYDDSTLVILYEYDDFPDNYKDYLKKLEETIENYELYENYFLIKAGILNITQEYRGSYDIKTALDNSVSTLKLESSDEFVIFGEEIWQQYTYQQNLQNALRKAYLNQYSDDFYVVFQPKMKDDELLGFEALSRWQHPELGFISPEDFIPIAENRDLIISLGERVVIETFKFINKLYDKGLKDFVVSINFSFKQLRSPYFLERFLTLARKHKIDLKNIGIEVTESIMIDDFETLNDKLIELQKQGLSIYLDDFGVGYSSLERVKNMPLDYIKIDRSFINLIDRDENLVDSIFDLVNSLNLEVIAEGVETKEQLEWLKNKSCSIIQGYYFSKPLKEDEALKFADKYIIK